MLIGGRQAGALRFVEYTPDSLIDNDELFESMDADSESACALAGVLCGAWECVAMDVSGYGPILEFSAAWMAPSFAHGGLWAQVAERVIEHISPRHALLVMKAFPLEYEGMAPEGSSVTLALLGRQAAMKRHYRRLFAVQAFPGKAGEDGWLWRIGQPFVDLIPPPSP